MPMPIGPIIGDICCGCIGVPGIGCCPVGSGGMGTAAAALGAAGPAPPSMASARGAGQPRPQAVFRVLP